MRAVKVLRKFLRPLPLAVVLSLCLAALIWLFGARMTVFGITPFGNEVLRGWLALFLTTLGVMLLVVWFISLWREYKAERSEREARPLTPEQLETRAMRQVFERATSVMAGRWEGAGDPINGLPWYLVMGAPGSGKSTMITASEMRRPIDHELAAATADLRGSGSGTMLEWHVAGSEAVLLQLSGSAFVAPETRSPIERHVWARFLKELQRVRPRRPLNGVILVIDLAEFCEMDTTARDAYATSIRRITDEIVRTIDTQITVHVVFTKLDLVAGFLDFFEDATAAERDELLGFHFDANFSKPWLEVFDEAYVDFLERMQARLALRMKNLKGVLSRQEAFAFARTFVGLRNPLRSLLATALDPDRFSTTPLFRGIYFAAPIQENAPRNIFLQAVGARYALPSPLYSVPQGAPQPYFAAQVLPRAIMPEGGLAGTSRSEDRSFARFAMVLGAACVAGVGTVSLFWFGKYGENLARASVLLEQVEEYSSQTMKSGGPLELEMLNTIRDATNAFGEYRDISRPEAILTLYKGLELGPLADESYRQLLHQRFMVQLTTSLEFDLRDVCPRGSDAQLEILRVLRMLESPDRRNLDTIQSYFRNRWRDNYPQNAEMQERLNSHLVYALQIEPQNYDINQELVRAAQVDLGMMTPYRRFYSSVRALAESQLPNAVEFRSAVGATFDIVYRADPALSPEREVLTTGPANDEQRDECGRIAERIVPTDPFEIPRFFTREQYHGFFVPQARAIAQVALDDLWVLGVGDTASFSDADLDQITENLRELYVEDYIRAWRQALNSMQIRPFSDLREAGEVLRGLSGVDSPIRRIAALVADNTVIYPPETVEPDITTGGATQLSFDSDRRAGLRINEDFRAIHRLLLGEEGTTQTDIGQIEAALTDLYEYIKSVRDATRPNAKALELAIERANLRGADPIFVVQRLAERTPAPFNTHLRDVARESWEVIMAAATQELNRKWNEEIYGEFQRLIAGRYPFDRDSPDDLPLQDFEDFFGPTGKLESFFRTELKTFVDENTGIPRIIDGQFLPMDPDFTANLRRAINITQTFFDNSGELSVQFSVQPIGMSANLSRAQLNFEGQLVISTHGAARPVRIVWPNALSGTPSSRMDLSPLTRSGASTSRQYDGPWSWLRLYDSSQKSGLADNSVDIAFSTANGQSAQFRIRSEGQVNPFFNSPLSSFSLPAYLRSPEDGS